MTTEKKTHTGHLNMRINRELKEAMTKCAHEIGERPAVFVRKSIINRMIENGSYEYAEDDAGSWQYADVE